MARSRNPTPPERKDVAYSVLMPLEMAGFLEAQKEPFKVKTAAEIVRALISSVRTWFSLPSFMAERLQKDLEEKNVTFLVYMQDLAARRYEELKAADAEKKKGQ